MEFNFEKKHALVTGAGKGIGRGIAKALWSAGAVTYALSRTQTDLDSLEEECPGIHTICIDLAADWDKTAAVVKSVGYIDLLVNNAGVLRSNSILEVSEEDYVKHFNTNVKTVLNICQVAARGMIERKQGGAIVNISSTLSSIGIVDKIVYAASKGALDQLTRCLAVELGPHQIRVNSVNPTIILDTQMSHNVSGPDVPPRIRALEVRTPQKHFGKIRDVVNATLYLLSDKADMINGAFLPVDGGLLCT